jgi:glycosyltransferase involved in cell wall biosynthesis
MSKFVIGVDCWALRLDGGGARFVFESLLAYFAKTEYRFLLFLHYEARQCIEEVERRVGLLRNMVKIPIEAPEQIYQYERLVDVLYCPFNNISVRLFDRPVVAVLHDVQEKYLPEMFSREELIGRHESYSDILRSADRIITISNFCRESFIEKYGAERARIDVIHNAPQEALIRQGSASDTSKRTAFFSGFRPGTFALYPANFYPHKNHGLLLQGFRLAMKEDPTLEGLVLVGKAWGSKSTPETYVAEQGLDYSVRILSNLMPSELASLYRDCSFVAIPTLFEGFCLPAVEALAFGVPLACSDLPILREITAEEAIFFDPNSPASIAHALVKAHRAERSEIARTRRLEIASRYSWDASAKRTLSILEQAVREHAKKRERAPQVLSVRPTFTLFVVQIDQPAEWLADSIRSVAICRSFGPSVRVIVLHNLADPAMILKVGKCYGVGIEAVDIREFDRCCGETLLRSVGAFGVVFAGSRITNDYFVAAATPVNESTVLLLGEVRQVHEDSARTHESHSYVRYAEDHQLFTGHIYPEMAIVLRPETVLAQMEAWSDLWRVWDACAKFLPQRRVKVVRRTLATVRYRSTRHFSVPLKAVPALRYRPVYSVMDGRGIVSRDDARFLRFVNEVVAPALSCPAPPAIEDSILE